MKLKMMLMRMNRQDRRDRTVSSSETNTYFREFNNNAAVVPKIPGIPPRVYFGQSAPTSRPMHTPLMGICQSSFGSSKLSGGPCQTNTTSNVPTVKTDINGNPLSNNGNRENIFPWKQSFPMMSMMKEASPAYQTKGIVTNVLCQWEGCHKLFKPSLIDHFCTTHLPESTDGCMCRWNNCRQRGKLFKTRYQLIDHLRKHTNTIFQCGVCTKSFSKKESLKIHLRTHTGERPYLCSFAGCQKTFKSSSDRCKHFKTHQETHPYRCSVSGCTKKYTDPSTRRKHEKMHLQKFGKQFS